MEPTASRTTAALQWIVVLVMPVLIVAVLPQQVGAQSSPVRRARASATSGVSASVPHGLSVTSSR